MPQLCYKGADGQWHPLGLLLKGKDGLTTSVNGVAQVDGNISLDAGHIPVSATDATTVQTALTQRDRVVSLLDNGDFAHPVNQRNRAGVGLAAGYMIDRWRTWADGVTIYFVPGKYMGLENVNLVQYLPEPYNRGVLTLGVKVYGEATPYVCTLDTAQNGSVSTAAGGITRNDSELFVKLMAGHAFEWAVLYPGTYTAATLPAPVFKGYAAELLECMRYFQRFPYSYVALGNYSMYQGYTPFYVPMRVVPTITILPYAAGSAGSLSDASSNNEDVAGAQANFVSNMGFRMQNGPGYLTAGHIYQCYVEASAELN